MPTFIKQVVVTGGGEITDSFRGDLVNSSSNWPILKERLIEIGGIVSDHLCSGTAF